MASQLQLRRGTKAQNDVFTGADGEVTINTDSKSLRSHDGVRGGGYEIGMAQANGMANLRTHTPAIGARRYLTHHTTDGDGGHGVFRADMSGVYVAADDNNGTVIVVGTNAWVREYSGTADSKWFGVIDDISSFASAINVSKSSPLLALNIANIDLVTKDNNINISATVNGNTYPDVMPRLSASKVCVQHNYNELSDRLTFLPQTSGNTPAAPIFTGSKQSSINVIAHWYNDFGLDAVRAANNSIGDVMWYYWEWLFKSSTSVDKYEAKRHPLLGFYRGDDINVLDWQCYWLNQAGVTGVSLLGTPSKIMTATIADREIWINRLLNIVPNFKALSYCLWQPTSPNVAAIDSEFAAILSLYQTYPNFSTHMHNGKPYPIVFLFDGESLRGTLDSYVGQTNTVAKLQSWASTFITAGYAGICVMVRNATTTLIGDQVLEAVGCIYMAAEYESTPTSAGGFDDGTYAHLANTITGNIHGKYGVPSVKTDEDSHSAHPSTWSRLDSTPKKFYTMCVNSIRQSALKGNPSIMTVYNVSEWAEGGASLQPNMRDGFGYIDALSQALNSSFNSSFYEPKVSRQASSFLPASIVPIILKSSATTIPFQLSYSWTSSALPFIAVSNHLDGRRIRLINTSVFTITLSNEATLVGSGLLLTTPTIALSMNDNVELEYDAARSLWIQVSSVINIV